jgi:hypothetical protein
LKGHKNKQVNTLTWDGEFFDFRQKLHIPGKFKTGKNRIFWYWGEESVRYRFTDSNSMTVPSLLMRQVISANY